MNKPHRTNSDFQLRHFIVGNCHTPDGAWCALYELQIVAEKNLSHAEAQRLEREATLAETEEVLASDAPNSQKLRAKAEAIKVNADQSIWEMNLIGAQNELACITALMAEVEPHCKYAELPIIERTEAAQQDEWAGELMGRAENMMLSNAVGIPWDHLQTMRSHPDFSTVLLPHIIKIGNTLRTALQSQNPEIIEAALTHPALPFLQEARK